jgi:transcription-repair coupling factor (superfamily II helicase)
MQPIPSMIKYLQEIEASLSAHESLKKWVIQQNDPQEIAFFILQIKQALKEIDQAKDLSDQTVKALKQFKQRSILLVTPTQEEAEKLQESLSFYLNECALLNEIPSPYGRLHFSKREIGENLAYLCEIAKQAKIICMSIHTLSKKTLSAEVLKAKHLILKKSKKIKRQDLISTLQSCGYQLVPKVLDPCTYAVRGDIVDIFPAQSHHPIRLEFWGDEIESIVDFLTQSQRKIGEEIKKEIIIAPVREYFFDEEFSCHVIDRIEKLSIEQKRNSAQVRPYYQDLENHIPFAGIENLLPAFYEHGLVPIWTHFKQQPFTLIIEPLRCQQILTDDLFRQLSLYKDELQNQAFALAPSEHFCEIPQIESFLESALHCRSKTIAIQDLQTLTHIEQQKAEFPFLYQPLHHHLSLRQSLDAAKYADDPFVVFRSYVQRLLDDQKFVIMVYQTKTQKERLQRILNTFSIKDLKISFDLLFDEMQRSKNEYGYVYLLQGPLHYGWENQNLGIALISAGEILNYAFKVKTNLHVDEEVVEEEEENLSVFFRSIRELKPNDYVVHMEYGIGQFIGIKKQKIEGMELDMIELRYDQDAKLYLTIDLLSELQKFVGPSDYQPKLTKPGSKEWQKIKDKVQVDIEEQAQKLLGLYAERAKTSRDVQAIISDEYRAFEASFPFQETKDQYKAIQDVLKDMSSSKPMDRLLCADVGFGKTEVAMRAAMKAVLDGKQVAVLVPTTMLAAQHEKTFKQRFANTPYHIEQYSRFISSSKQKEIAKALKDHSIHIVIGTHGLLNKSIQFDNLGLLILDEEHKFGVQHKEKLKELKANIDVLAMTATPIPRTLQMSLSGIRDVSEIRTPPMARLSTHTELCKYNTQVIREVMLREIERGGQVFYVHNRVSTIAQKKEFLQTLVPEARMTFVHGQMDPEILEETIFKFTQGAFNVLVATSIIEAGIDIPNANTMIIEDSHCFGLAQLHQMRGRVGRSNANIRGYCYLLTPERTNIDQDAQNRLTTLVENSSLGSGFDIAHRDLEFRGAGEILGNKQKGQVQSVGLDMYMVLLEDAIAKGKGIKQLEFKPMIKIPLRTEISDLYIVDNDFRLEFYQKIASSFMDQHLLQIEEELKDRFGSLPVETQNLIYQRRIYILAKKLGLKLLEYRKVDVVFSFDLRSKVNFVALPKICQQDRAFYIPKEYSIAYRFQENDFLDGVFAGVWRSIQDLNERIQRL